MDDKEYDPHFLTIEDLTKNKTYMIPVYQRPYSWGKEQVNDLLEDMLQSFESEEKLFTGTMYARLINSDNGITYRYEIIDGQQRMITFALIKLCLYSIITKSRPDDIYSNEFITLKNCLWKYIARENDRKMRLIDSGSIEKDLLASLFNACFDSPIEFSNYIYDRKTSNEIEKNLITSTTIIYTKLNGILNNDKSNNSKILDFCSYVLNRINVIFIETKTERKKVFKMFEAINSKGKQLEEIDLIKTYIFSELDEEDYDQYLDKWGFLIKETANNLEDYLWVYVKAFIKYNKYSVSIKKFKNLLNGTMSRNRTV